MKVIKEGNLTYVLVDMDTELLRDWIGPCEVCALTHECVTTDLGKKAADLCGEDGFFLEAIE